MKWRRLVWISIVSSRRRAGSEETNEKYHENVEYQYVICHQAGRLCLSFFASWFYVGYTFDFKVQVFNQWSGGLDGFFAPVVSQLVQHQFQPGLELFLPVVVGILVGHENNPKIEYQTLGKMILALPPLLPWWQRSQSGRFSCCESGGSTVPSHGVSIRITNILLLG